jgi:predicted transcriptional regulator
VQRTDPSLPTDAELVILNVLWKHGPSTVRQVADQLDEAGRAVAYTTVLKMLQIMHQKGLVSRDERQRHHVYAAGSPPERTQASLIESLTTRAFGGSTARLVMRALDATRATKEEREQIRALLDRLDTDEPEEEPR